jgi:hypothetical protein
MSRRPIRRLPLTALLAVAMFTLAATGCQNNRAAVIPPPGGTFPGDAYYNRPAAASGGMAPAGAGSAAGVNLSPGDVRNLPPPPITSGANAANHTPRDTYDVATRVAADSQPIRVLDSTASSSGSLTSAPRGMTLNDGTTARSWQAGAPVPSSVASNPFSQIRGGSSTPGSLPQGFSGQDGQWRSRSSYEGTERR